MKIAQIAPLAESCPPRLYGGTERIVSYLTEELVRQGHDVTLFASGDSRTQAELAVCCDVALRLNPAVSDPLLYHVMMMEEVRRRADEFDVLHFHVDFLHYLLATAFADRMLTTLHGRLDLPDLTRFYGAFPRYPLVSVSDDQRRPVPAVNWAGTVHHGLPQDLLPFSARPKGDYLAFLGRISPEKRPDRAIEIAARAGLKLKIAAKVDKADQAYWDEAIAPMVAAHPNVDFIGEINEDQKADFLGDARALLFPIDWPEPFGLVMIEAMACGTPVVAFANGSVPEVIDDGVTGFIVNGIDEAAAAVRSVERLDRAEVRATFEQRFTAERMALDYLAIYRGLPGLRRAAMGIPAAAAGLSHGLSEGVDLTGALGLRLETEATAPHIRERGAPAYGAADGAPGRPDSKIVGEAERGGALKAPTGALDGAVPSGIDVALHGFENADKLGGAAGGKRRP